MEEQVNRLSAGGQAGWMSGFLNSCRQASWRRVTVWSLCILLLLLAAFGFCFQRARRSNWNLDSVYVRLTRVDGQPLPPSIRVISVSPWSKTEFERNHGVWTVPGEGKRLMKGMLLEMAVPEKPEDYRCSCATSDRPSARWTELAVRSELEQPGEGIATYALVGFPHQGSLIPFYRNTINWRGDLRIVLYSAFGAAWLVGWPCLVIYLFLRFRRAIAGCAQMGLQAFRADKSAPWILAAMGFAFLLLNRRNVSLPVVMYRQFDELTFFQYVVDVFRNRHFDVAMYGFPWDFASTIASIPGMLLGSFDSAILAGRMISALSVVASLVVLRRIALRHLGTLGSWIYLLYALAVPFVWIMGNCWHPDATMTMLLLAGIGQLLLDQGRFERHYFVSLFFLVGAAATKWHAFMFAPLLPLYFLSHWSSWWPRGCGWRGISRPIVRSVACLLASWIIWEPRTCLPDFLPGMLDGFLFQMWTNQTGFDVTVATQVPLLAKWHVLADWYAPWPVLCLLVSSAVILSLGRLLRPSLKGLEWIGVTWLIVVAYNMLWVNKLMPYYYFSPFMVGLVLPVLLLHHLRLPRSWTCLSLGLVCAVQMAALQPACRRVWQDRFYMPDQETVKLQEDTSALIAAAVKDWAPRRILLEYNLSFDYVSAGVSASKVGYLNTDFYQKIIAKDWDWIQNWQWDLVALRERDLENWTRGPKGQLAAQLLRMGYIRAGQNSLSTVYVRTTRK